MRASRWKMWPPLTAAQPLGRVTQWKDRFFFLGKNEPLIISFLFLTQTVDFSSPGPKEFDYFCFKQYKRDTILTKYILTDFSFLIVLFLWVCFQSGKLCVSITDDSVSGFLASLTAHGDSTVHQYLHIKFLYAMKIKAWVDSAYLWFGLLQVNNVVLNGTLVSTHFQ